MLVPNPGWGGKGDSQGDIWRALGLFSLYRFFVAGMVTTLVVLGTGPQALGSSHPRLFLLLATGYLLLSLVFGVATRLRRPAPNLQIYLQAATDISCITLLTYTSGGVTSGLGVLAIPAIAGLGLLAPGRPALLFAALASIALLLAQIHGYWLEPGREAALTETGLLGAGLFATALLALVLARRARESEALAQRRGADLAGMAELNAHIIEGMHAGIIVVNDDDRVHLVNGAARRLLGQPAAAQGTDLGQLSPALQQALSLWRQAPTETRPQTLAAEADRPELRVRFTRLGEHQIADTIVLLEDTAELRRQTQALKLASLGRLTASIAHEIRNPLGAISHAAQLLGESEALDPADRRLAGIIQDQSRRMNHVIQNVLDLSRRHPPQMVPLDLGARLAQFSDEFRRHHGLPPEQLTWSLPGADQQVWFDPGHLHQVLWNLCTNALRHGYRSGESPCILLRGNPQKTHGAASLDVIDRGPGIDSIVARRLFDPFISAGGEGVGLGLYISRELCENNGGSLDLIPLADGTCFRIQFPAPNGAPPSSHPTLSDG
ncbi:two-component system, NtrC family, sensor histidine kinase PilS [Ectothiorhodospira magna]|uniref:histidine kinase n=1 Tax=Ectothiorhodospira magna TaxID=867345 RepID=A0A1H8Z8R0_9GAMM|nr:ATP-binding protein [Ectothiorhodospira magna]SEP60824.1 two-component system, NtrC family, sensor histidine kinase PilS [Ectothiorhodospira magna]